MRKIALIIAMVMVAAAVIAADQKSNVVKELLPGAELKPQVFAVTDALTAKVQAALGNKMPVRKEYEIYASKDGAVVIEEQMGKWGVIKMAVLIDDATKKVKNIGYISMSEKRGAGIKQANFVKQFAGKTADDPIMVGKDINGISGATISSKAVAIAVKRALVVYGAFTEKK